MSKNTTISIGNNLTIKSLVDHLEKNNLLNKNLSVKFTITTSGPIDYDQTGLQITAQGE